MKKGTFANASTIAGPSLVAALVAALFCPSVQGSDYKTLPGTMCQTQHQDDVQDRIFASSYFGGDSVFVCGLLRDAPLDAITLVTLFIYNTSGTASCSLRSMDPFDDAGDFTTTQVPGSGGQQVDFNEASLTEYDYGTHEVGCYLPDTGYAFGIRYAEG